MLRIASGLSLAYTTENGIIVAEDKDTLGLFKGIQRGVNAIMKSKGISSANWVVVDGRLGANTLLGVQRVMAALPNPSLPMVAPTTVDRLANSAEGIYAWLNVTSPTNVSTSASILESDYRPRLKPVDDGDIVIDPEPKKSSYGWLIGLALVGGGAWLLMSGKRKR